MWYVGGEESSLSYEESEEGEEADPDRLDDDEVEIAWMQDNIPDYTRSTVPEEVGLDRHPVEGLRVLDRGLEVGTVVASVDNPLGQVRYVRLCFLIRG